MLLYGDYSLRIKTIHFIRWSHELVCHLFSIEC